MLDSGFPDWPSYTAEETQAVTKTLLSNRVNYWTGEEGKLFEQEFAKSVNSEYAIAVSNGTVAISAALYALDIRAGDEIILSPRVYFACVSCIVMAGATPVFVDIDRESQNISVDTIRQKINSKTKAILAVHLAGYPCDMDEMMLLAKQFDLSVIEDCAQAHGARYKGRSVGSIGHIGTWSFCQDKIITTGGEGGMLTTNSAELWEKMWSYKDHGKSHSAVFNTQHSPGFRWLHESFGTNSRMTEMQAAIGRIQLRRLKGWTAKRNVLAEILNDQFSGKTLLRTVKPTGSIQHAYFKYYVFLRPEWLKTDWTRERIIEEIVRAGVPCSTGSCSEVYREKAFDNTEWAPKERLPVAQELGETSLMYLVHPTLTEENVLHFAKITNWVIDQATENAPVITHIEAINQ